MLKWSKKSLTKTNDTAGDGTTTATVLAKAILNEAESHSLLDDERTMREGINSGVDKVVKYLDKCSKKVTGKKIDQVATISANNDKAIGEIIGKAFKLVNETGVVIDKIMPGSWSLYLDKETETNRMFMDSDAYEFDTLQLSQVDLGEVLINTEVLIGGKIYWDFNQNDIADLSELISEANITVTSLDGEIQFTIQSGEDGVWSQLVPIQNTYNISVEKIGYSDGYYNSDEADGVVVESVPKSFDVSIDANNVQV